MDPDGPPTSPPREARASTRAFLDVTVPIRPGIAVFPGDPSVSVERVQSIALGGVCNVSRLDLGAHTGTHIDAPVHFIEGAPGVDAVPLSALVGPAVVVDARSCTGVIDARAIERLAIPEGTERVLFQTQNSRLWDLPSFSPEFIGLDASAARALVERGVVLVGIDYLSIAPFGDPAPTHRALLGAGVVIVEGLDFRHVEPGDYELVCLPLLIPGCDAAPARTILTPPGAAGSGGGSGGSASSLENAPP